MFTIRLSHRTAHRGRPAYFRWDDNTPVDLTTKNYGEAIEILRRYARNTEFRAALMNNAGHVILRST